MAYVSTYEDRDTTVVGICQGWALGPSWRRKTWWFEADCNINPTRTITCSTRGRVFAVPPGNTLQPSLRRNEPGAVDTWTSSSKSTRLNRTAVDPYLMYPRWIFLSIRPGRMRAGSRDSGWLVVMITMRPGVSTTPSRAFKSP